MKNTNKAQLIQRAIIDDSYLLRLYAERVKIYYFVHPTAILNLETGKVEIIWIDETNNKNLSKIDELIQFRIDQIKSFFNV